MTHPVPDLPAVQRLEANGAVGFPTPNGALILASKVSASHDKPQGPRAFIVLCLSHNEFVTWVLFVDVDSSKAECFWGNYFGHDLMRACADYEGRT